MPHPSPACCRGIQREIDLRQKKADQVYLKLLRHANALSCRHKSLSQRLLITACSARRKGGYVLVSELNLGGASACTIVGPIAWLLPSVSAFTLEEEALVKGVHASTPQPSACWLALSAAANDEQPHEIFPSDETHQIRHREVSGFYSGSSCVHGAMQHQIVCWHSRDRLSWLFHPRQLGSMTASQGLGADIFICMATCCAAGTLVLYLYGHKPQDMSSALVQERGKARAMATALSTINKFIIRKKTGDNGRIFGRWDVSILPGLACLAEIVVRIDLH